MKKTDFLKDVKHEIDMLKKHGTKEELNKLNFANFSHTSPTHCIYGLMTGNCANKRAKVLMDKSCIRVMDLSNGVVNITDKTFSEIKGSINGANEGQGWNIAVVDDIQREYQHLSALEGYICLKNAKIKSVLKYLRGETKTLVL